MSVAPPRGPDIFGQGPRSNLDALGAVGIGFDRASSCARWRTPSGPWPSLPVALKRTVHAAGAARLRNASNRAALAALRNT